jgi:hypothetical protein
MCQHFGTHCSIFIGQRRWNGQGVLKHWHLTLWHTQLAVSRSEPPMSCF